MKKHLKNAIRGWITTLFAVVILTLISIKIYTDLDINTITLTHVAIIMTIITFAISLIFAPDDFIGRLVDRFILKKKQNK